MGDAVFIINDTKIYVPVVTLSKEDNKDFIEQQNKGFQRFIYWNEYKTKGQDKYADANNFKYISLDPSFQGVNRLFVIAYSRADNNQPTKNGQRKYYLPRIDLDPSFQSVNRLFVMTYNRADNNQPTKNGQRKYYLPRIDLEKYNVIIDGRNFYDNPIESDIEKYRD